MKHSTKQKGKFDLSFTEFFSISLAVAAILIPLNLQLKSSLDQQLYKNERESRYHNSLGKELEYNLHSMTNYMASLSRGEYDMKYLVQNDIYLAGISSGDILILGESRKKYDDIYIALQKIEDVGRIENRNLTQEKIVKIFKETGTDLKSISNNWEFDSKVYEAREAKVRMDSNMYNFWFTLSNVATIALTVLIFKLYSDWKNERQL